MTEGTEKERTEQEKKVKEDEDVGQEEAEEEEVLGEKHIEQEESKNKKKTKKKKKEKKKKSSSGSSKMKKDAQQAAKAYHGKKGGSNGNNNDDNGDEFDFNPNAAARRSKSLNPNFNGKGRKLALTGIDDEELGGESENGSGNGNKSSNKSGTKKQSPKHSGNPSSSSSNGEQTGNGNADGATNDEESEGVREREGESDAENHGVEESRTKRNNSRGSQSRKLRSQSSTHTRRSGFARVMSLWQSNAEQQSQPKLPAAVMNSMYGQHNRRNPSTSGIESRSGPTAGTSPSTSTSSPSASSSSSSPSSSSPSSSSPTTASKFGIKWGSSPKGSSSQAQAQTHTQASASSEPPGHTISGPTNVKHEVHAEFDPKNLKYQGVPDTWEGGSAFKQFGAGIKECPRVEVEGYKERIPALLVTLKEHLVQNDGLKYEGVFRVSADRDRQRMYKEQVDSGEFKGCLVKDDAICMAALIKEWLRANPIRLLNSLPRNVVCDAGSPTLGKSAQEIVRMMPEPYESVFLWLVDLLIETLDLEKYNKMNPKAISIVVAPNIYRCEAGTNAMDEIPEMEGAAALLEKCIAWRREQKAGKAPAKPLW